MKTTVAITLLLLVGGAARSTASSVQNVRVAQLRDGSQQVEVRYDLGASAGEEGVNIAAVASVDGGQSWTLRVQTVLPVPGQGAPAFGPGVHDGNDIGFLWSAGEDYPDFSCLDLTIRVVASDPTGFTRTYGGEGFDIGYCLVATSDGGALIVGSTSSYGGGGRDLWVVKVDEEGNEQWQRLVGGAQDEVGLDAAVLPGGGYLVAGTVESWGTGGSDLFLLRIDADGVPIWGRNFGGAQDDTNPHVEAMSGGDILLGGSLRRIDGLPGDPYWHSDVYLARLDSLGEPRWESLLDGPGRSCVEDEPTHEGPDALIGLHAGDSGSATTFSDYFDTCSYFEGYRAVWRVEYAGDGTILDSSLPLYDWNHQNESWFWTRAYQPLPGSGYLLAGDYSSIEGHQAFVFRAGQEPWHEIYADLPNYFNAITLCADGTVIGVGRTRDTVGGQLMIARLSRSGALLWWRSYDVWTESMACDVHECLDGSLLIAGSADGDLLILKTDADGNLTP